MSDEQILAALYALYQEWVDNVGIPEDLQRAAEAEHKSKLHWVEMFDRLTSDGWKYDFLKHRFYQSGSTIGILTMDERW